MPKKETQTSDSSSLEPTNLTRRQKIAGAVALGVGALGAAGLTVHEFNSLGDGPATTTTTSTTEATTTTSTTESPGVVVDPEGQSGGVIVTLENPDVTVPADSAIDSPGTNGASVEGVGPTATVVTRENSPKG